MTTNTYTMIADGSCAIRSSDGSVIPWDVANNQPLDIGGLVGRTWVADGSPIPAAYVAPPAAVPEEISDRQFFQQLAIQGLITQAEALAYVTVGALPTTLATAIAALPTANNVQFNAQMAIVGAKTFDRHNPNTIMLGAALGQTAADLDAIWTAAAALT